MQEADARRHELGRTARVANIIGVLRGERPEAIGLVAHYDSSPDAPGATDDALGVGVALEAARVFAASSRKRWSMFVIATDGEESGLMGAAALVTDREVTERLRAYLNLESVGSAGTAVLFETGPGNSWLVSPWARRAPHPRGGSYALEIYQRLPNDTDFSILKTRDIPGLNFAPIGDSYAYHTARDTPERLARRNDPAHRRERRLDCRGPPGRGHHAARHADAHLPRHRRNGGGLVPAGGALAAGGRGTAARRHRLGPPHGRRGSSRRHAAMADDVHVGVARRRRRVRIDDRRDLAAAPGARGLSPLVRATRTIVRAADRDRHDGRLEHGSPWPVASPPRASDPAFVADLERRAARLDRADRARALVRAVSRLSLGPAASRRGPAAGARPAASRRAGADLFPAGAGRVGVALGAGDP